MRFVNSILSVLLTVGGIVGGGLPAPQAQATLAVKGSVAIMRPDVSVGKKSGNIKYDNSNVVVWLKPASSSAGKPLDRQTAARPVGTRARFKILQQNKRFDPHILVVPVGSLVDFPNLDPFFHNVFSMFDGKRFDLGLYEAGASHAVSFDSPGICYIFCNIHPDMSAAIVVVDSPYFAVSNPLGEFSIANVPPGTYLISVWHELGKPAKSDVFPREVTITPANTVLQPIRLLGAGPLLMPHKNKYGKDYDPSLPTPLYK